MPAPLPQLVWAAEEAQSTTLGPIGPVIDQQAILRRKLRRRRKRHEASERGLLQGFEKHNKACKRRMKN